MITRLIDNLIPRRLGGEFRWLFAATAASQLADGIILAAGPLLVTSITRDPFAVAASLVAQRLPWVLFSLPAGAWVDRLSRRHVVTVVNVLRGGVVGLLAVAEWTGSLGLPLLYGTLFALGSAEVLGDTGKSALLKEVAPADHLGLASARLGMLFFVGNQLAGPAIGAVLFAASSALPFGTNAGLYLVAAVTVTRIAGRPNPSGPRRRLGSDIADGLRWLRTAPAVRRLVILIAIYNVSFGAAYAVWVLYALERLGLDDVGFGFLLSLSAVGGLVGSAVYERLEGRFGNVTLLRTGLVLETVSHAAFASTSSPVLAGGIMFAFGVHTAVWGSLSTSIRLRATPDELAGRVSSINTLGVFGTLVLGGLIGGALAEPLGVLAPFWFAFAVATVTTVWAWRGIEDIGRL